MVRASVGVLIFRDLPLPAQTALEQRLLNTLRRARGGPVLERDANAATLAVLSPTVSSSSSSSTTSPTKPPASRRSRRRAVPAKDGTPPFET